MANTKNSAAFWEILGKISPKFNAQPSQISKQAWENYFTKCYSAPPTILNQSQKKYIEILFKRNNLPNPPTSQTQEIISKDEIFLAIKQLAKNKAAGKDSILNEMLKSSFPHFIDLLYQLFNKCWKNHKFPSSWGEVLVIPIYKKGNKSSPDNYRPISLVQNIAKLYLTIIQKKLVAWVDSRGLIPDAQTAFRKGMGCPEQLFTLRSLISKQYSNESGCTYVLFADLSKAFDSVDHVLLWEKLKAFGIPKALLANIQSFYSQLVMQVKTDQGLTKKIKITRGVLQGDPISPILFNLFLSDLPNCLPKEIGVKSNNVTTNILMFADDIALLATDHAQLNKLIKRLKIFLDLNMLNLNPNKSKVIIFAKKIRICHSNKIR